MKTPLVIFGTGEIASLAHWYFSRDSDHEVVGFTVDREYMTDSRFEGLPVIPAEEVVAQFPPETHAAFVALSYSGLNAVRSEKYHALKSAGYEMTSYVSSYATILNDGQIGENCFILEDNTVQPFVNIGNNVTLWSGNHIGHHSTIADDCFLASHIVVSGGVTIEQACFIGVNATLRDHITIGARSVIGAGAVILSDCEAEGVFASTATERARIPSSKLRRI